MEETPFLPPPPPSSGTDLRPDESVGWQGRAGSELSGQDVAMGQRAGGQRTVTPAQGQTITLFGVRRDFIP